MSGNKRTLFLCAESEKVEKSENFASPSPAAHLGDDSPPPRDDCFPTDTEFAINSLEDMVKCFPPFVFMHQIYELIPNVTQADSEAEMLRRKMQYRALYCSQASALGNIVVLRNENYHKDFFTLVSKIASKLHSSNALFNGKLDVDGMKRLTAKFSALIMNCSQLSITKQLFLTGIKNISGNADDTIAFLDVEIECLVQLGFLRISGGAADSEMLWFSHPSLGSFFKHVFSAEKQMVSWIKRLKHKEVTEKRLVGTFGLGVADPVVNNMEIAAKRRRLQVSNSQNPFVLANQSPFSIRYHLLDLLGRKRLVRVSGGIPGEYVIRFVL